jgi:hypothetical protein
MTGNSANRLSIRRPNAFGNPLIFVDISMNVLRTYVVVDCTARSNAANFFVISLTKSAGITLFFAEKLCCSNVTLSLIPLVSGLQAQGNKLTSICWHLWR